MDFDALESLRREHPAWRLLNAEHAVLIVSFLHHSFLRSNKRSFPKEELASQLDDFLHHVRTKVGEDAFPRRADQYLDDWASDDRAWLRKVYASGEDQPYFDITPSTEKAIDWIASLAERQFIGTESRLMTVFTLLREIAEGTEPSPSARIAELERRRAAIDQEIQRIRGGRMAFMDSTGIKDRFLQIAQTARALLSDFREVEQNFRALDRAARERIALWSGSKAELLDDIFGQRDSISNSDQGKSFQAFWEFLMSNAKQEELTTLLKKVFDLEPVKSLNPNTRLLRVHYDWLEAGESAQRTVARLSQQLRRYVDEQVAAENRRITEIIRGIEQHALSVRDLDPVGTFAELDGSTPSWELIMDRPLFSPPFHVFIQDNALEAGNEDFAADALYEQVYVDKNALEAHIRWALQTRTQISLQELTQTRPLEQGLEELIAYMSIAADQQTAIIDDTVKDTITWTDTSGIGRQATLPLVIFCSTWNPRAAHPSETLR